ncbi:MAG: ABC transporter permease subunit [Microbacteriaceae bacterium]
MTIDRESLRTSVRQRGGSLALTIAAPTVLFLLLGLLWQLVATRLASILPPLEEVAADFLSRPDFYALNLLETLHSGLLGLAAGVIVAIGLAVAIVHVRVLRAAIIPLALLLNVTPVVAISPALVVAFGFTATPHVIVAAISAFFPMLINAITGLQRVDSGALDVFRVLGASRLDVFLRLRVPTSLPFLFVGLRLSVTTAMVGAVVSEFTGTAKGIGAVIVNATAYLNLSQMWCAIGVSALTSLALLGLVTILERISIRW